MCVKARYWLAFYFTVMWIYSGFTHSFPASATCCRLSGDGQNTYPVVPYIHQYQNYQLQSHSLCCSLGSVPEVTTWKGRRWAFPNHLPLFFDVLEQGIAAQSVEVSKALDMQKRKWCGIAWTGAVSVSVHRWNTYLTAQPPPWSRVDHQRQVLRQTGSERH